MNVNSPFGIFTKNIPAAAFQQNQQISTQESSGGSTSKQMPGFVQSVGGGSLPPAATNQLRIVTLFDVATNIDRPAGADDDSYWHLGNVASQFEFQQKSIITAINLSTSIYNPTAGTVGIQIAVVNKLLNPVKLRTSPNILLSNFVMSNIQQLQPEQTSHQTTSFVFETWNAIYVQTGDKLAIHFSAGDTVAPQVWKAYGCAQIYYMPLSQQ